MSYSKFGWDLGHTPQSTRETREQLLMAFRLSQADMDYALPNV
jgi:hypothetical protein